MRERIELDGLDILRLGEREITMDECCAIEAEVADAIEAHGELPDGAAWAMDHRMGRSQGADW